MDGNTSTNGATSRNDMGTMNQMSGTNPIPADADLAGGVVG